MKRKFQDISTDDQEMSSAASLLLEPSAQHALFANPSGSFFDPLSLLHLSHTCSALRSFINSFEGAVWKHSFACLYSNSDNLQKMQPIEVARAVITRWILQPQGRLEILQQQLSRAVKQLRKAKRALPRAPHAASIQIFLAEQQIGQISQKIAHQLTVLQYQKEQLKLRCQRAKVKFESDLASRTRNSDLIAFLEVSSRRKSVAFLPSDPLQKVAVLIVEPDSSAVKFRFMRHETSTQTLTTVVDLGDITSSTLYVASANLVAQFLGENTDTILLTDYRQRQVQYWVEFLDVLVGNDRATVRQSFDNYAIPSDGEGKINILDETLDLIASVFGVLNFIFAQSGDSSSS